MADAKHDLVALLKARAFEPVLHARAGGRSDADRRRLEHVKHATLSEIERFEHYRSAEEVVINFKRDLDSAPAKKVHAELKSLGLPTLHDIRPEFERRAHELGVRI
jgi:hypothetical protein